MINVSGLYCGYGKTNVLHDVSFKVNKGGRLSIIGPNGCGKTTLLKAIANLLKYKGSIKYDGIEVSCMKQKECAKKIALLTQTTNVYFPYTVFEVTAFGLYSRNNSITGRLTKEEKETVMSAIRDVGLLKEKDRLISKLSGGQFQRVFLAKAFAQSPDVLLLDEPTNHLDIKCQYDFLEQINNWSAGGNKTVVSIMHDLNIAAQFSNDVIMVDNGRVAFSGKMQQLMNSSQLKEAFQIDIKGIMTAALKKWE